MSDERPQLEDDRVPVRRIVWALVFALVVSFLLGGWAAFTLRARERRLRPSGRFPEKSERVHSVAGLRVHLFFGETEAERSRAQARADLEQYRYVDREAGIITIPIDRAIELVLAGAR